MTFFDRLWLPIDKYPGWCLAIFMLAVAGFIVWLFTSETYNSNTVAEDQSASGNLSLRTIEVRGSKHEFIFWHDAYKGGMAHLPECRFCKERKVQ